MNDIRTLVIEETLDRLRASVDGPSVPQAAEIRAALVDSDLFGGAFEYEGFPVDSLALTELLVQIEEELDFNVFDTDRADDVRSIGDIVDIVISTVPRETLTHWLGRSDGEPPPGT